MNSKAILEQMRMHIQRKQLEMHEAPDMDWCKMIMMHTQRKQEEMLDAPIHI